MIWPVNGTVTSGYGYRIHPILGKRILHTGIDIAAASGTSIWAADGGTVIYATWVSGYGNTVAIDHGGGISTLYAHQSSMAVSYGQKVKKGQVVGYVGSTGYSTGPHLHFEVRVNGTPVDPMGYLP
jgi:murein DD-endopeptidase MepM/ murein hydrolase activator NlpD